MKNFNNIIFDTDYTLFIVGGGFPKIEASTLEVKKKQALISPPEEAKWFLNKILSFLVPGKVSTTPSNTKKWDKQENGTLNGTLKEKVQKLLELSDEQYSDKLLDSELRGFLYDVEKEFLSATVNYKTHISPSYWEVKPSSFNISGIYGKTYYLNSFPSYIDFLWTRDILNFYGKWDMSFFIYPADDSAIQTMLKRRTTQLKAEMSELIQKGITMDSDLQVEYNDVENIRQQLATKEERYFELSSYITVYNNDYEKLTEDSKRLEQKMGGFGIGIKPTTQRMDEGMTSNLPIMLDDLWIYRSAVTGSLTGSFPFVSSDLVDSTGILYGANLHTGGLVIFDRFGGWLPNHNAVVLATSGAGKSFAVKLEILRYLLEGVDIIVIDPENEYKPLVENVWGTYINIAINSDQFINPFDMPPKVEDVEYGKGDLLRSQILWLIGLIDVLVGGLSPEEEALIDKALQSTYALKGITFDIDDYSGKTVPLMQDLLAVLEGMKWSDLLALKISKYVTGTFSKLFNNATNVDLTAGLTVFSIRDIEDSLKTPAMYNVLNYIWTKVRSNKTKRLLIIDEAWIMLQKDISANFLFGLIKRARKYKLGVTTITQDVDDFIKSDYGKPIVTNSSLQLLLRQSTASIQGLEKVFWLSEAEKQKLVSSGIGEGIMMAGNQHVAVKILPSQFEKDFLDGLGGKS